MLIDVQQLEAIRQRFVELGDSIRSASKANEDYFNSTRLALDSLNKFAEEALSTFSFEKINKLQQNIKNFADDYNGAIGKVVKNLDVPMRDFEKSLKLTGDNLNDVTKDLSDLVKKRKKPGILSRALKSKPGRILTKEVTAIYGRVEGFVGGTLHMPTPRNIMGGLLGMLAYGIADATRVQAEAGEVKNIVVSAVDGTISSIVRNSTRYVSNLQEGLQKFYGISKQEVQNILSEFAKGGVEMKRVTTPFHSDFDKTITSSITKFSLALDKMFEVAGGTSAKQMVSFMADYGKTVEEAKDTATRLLLIGQQQGIGALQFSQNVLQASDSLKKWGFDIDKVIDLAATLQDRFEDMGVPRHFAGRQAALGLSQLASGMINMSDGMKMLIAEEMGLGSGLKGINALMDAATRVKEGRSPEETVEFFSAMARVALRHSGGDKDQAIHFLRTVGNMGYEGAKTALMLQEAVSEGKLDTAREIANTYKGALSGSLETEREKFNKAQQYINQALKGVAQMGIALLQAVVNAFTSLAASFKALPVIVANFFAGRSNEDVYAEIKSLSGDNKAVMAGLSGGFDKVMSAFSSAGSDVLGGSFEKAASFDYKNPSLLPGARRAPSTGVQIVRVPVMSGDTSGSYAFTGPKGTPSSSQGGRGRDSSNRGLDFLDLAAGDDSGWVGGSIYLEGKGVTERGDIELELKGNCPRCGLIFGDAPPEENTSATTGISGAQKQKRPSNFSNLANIVNVNTGQKATLDPTSSQGMQELSTLSRGRKSRKAGVKGTLDPKIGNIINQIAEDFPGKKIKIYSGHREGGGEHGKGRAIDLGVEGVSNAELFKYAQENIKGGGKGFYPNQPFIHLDVRPNKAIWVDMSKKGESSKGKTLGGAQAQAWLKENL